MAAKTPSPYHADFEEVRIGSFAWKKGESVLQPVAGNALIAQFTQGVINAHSYQASKHDAHHLRENPAYAPAFSLAHQQLHCLHSRSALQAKLLFSGGGKVLLEGNLSGVAGKNRGKVEFPFASIAGLDFDDAKRTITFQLASPPATYVGAQELQPVGVGFSASSGRETNWNASLAREQCHPNHPPACLRVLIPCRAAPSSPTRRAPSMTPQPPTSQVALLCSMQPSPCAWLGASRLSRPSCWASLASPSWLPRSVWALLWPDAFLGSWGWQQTSVLISVLQL